MFPAVLGLAFPVAQIGGWQRVSIIAPTFLAGIAVLTVAAVGVAVTAGRRRRWLRRVGVLVSLLGLVAGVAAGVNSYYAYLPNVASLSGWRATDQASWSTARLATAHPPLALPPKLPPHGAVVRVPIPGTRSGFRGRPAEVYLPPAWFASPRPPLPVIVMLHGTPGTPEDWTRSSGADEISDRWAADHHGMAPILVMPDINRSFYGDSECTDGTAGNVETYLTVDVPNWVLTHLQAAGSRGQWAVGGLSEGGTCAFNLAMRHPERWATFLDFGGDDHISRAGGVLGLFTGPTWHRRQLAASYDPVQVLYRLADPASVQGWFEVGQSDGPTTRAALQLAASARLRGMTVHLAVRRGGRHNWRVWRACFNDALPWVASRLGLGPSTTAGGVGRGTRLIDLTTDPARFLSHTATASPRGKGPVATTLRRPSVRRRHGLAHQVRPPRSGPPLGLPHAGAHRTIGR